MGWRKDVVLAAGSQYVLRDMNLTGQNALVVGGGTGMGAAIALALAKEGVRVGIAGRRKDKLADVAAQAGAGMIHTHEVDVASRASVQRLFEWFDGELGRLHLLVNSAGINVPRRSTAELSPEDWDRLMAINASGAFYCLHYGLPYMRKHGEGLVINICSTSGKRAAPLGGLGYNASKFAMAALGTSAGEEERQNGIRITTLFPGEVDTPIMECRPTPPTAEHRAKILKAEDIGALVVALVKLPARLHVPELIVKPLGQSFI